MQSGKRNLDIDLLRTLIAIADSGSFSVAASQLGRTQSAVSLQIKRLEEIVGQCLLARAQGRASRPTAEGELLIEYGRRILRLNDEACNCFDRPTLAGKLRLGLPEELMEGIFHHVLTDFSSAFPKVELSVRCDFSVRLSALIETGELDLALIKRVVKNDDTKDASSVNSLRREPLVWFTGNGSDASKQRPLPPRLVPRRLRFSHGSDQRTGRPQTFDGERHSSAAASPPCAMRLLPAWQSHHCHAAWLVPD